MSHVAELSPMETVVRAVRPYFVCRLSGLPTDALDQLVSSELPAVLDTLGALERDVARGRAHVSDQLHDAIGAIEEKALRNTMLQLRRDVFRGRRLTDPQRALARRILPEHVMTAIEALSAVTAACDAARSDARARHAVALRDSRAAFQQLVGNDDFRKGVLLSSPALFASLRRYTSADPRKLNSRDEQIERGLLRYFTRAAAKTTPFGTFCAVVPGAFDCERTVGSAVRLSGDPDRKRGFVRLNKTLYAMLWAHLKTRGAVRSALAVEANPTLERHDEHRLRFLVARGTGGEAFQRLQANDAIDVVLDVVRAHGGATYRHLIGVLTTDARVEATEADAVAYLDRLLDVGLLRFRSVVREQEPDWDLPLGAFLREVDDEHAQIVSDHLERLRVAMTEYAAADAAGRVVSSRSIRDAIIATLTALGIAADIPRDLPLYEDATADVALQIARTPSVVSALDRLAEYVAWTQPLAYPRGEVATMRHFFTTFYGGASAVPLLTFYEDFYREHFKTHLGKQRRLQAGDTDSEVRAYDVLNPFGLDVIRDVDHARRRIILAIQRRWAAAPGADEVVLDSDDLAEALGPLSPPRPTVTSANVFGQLVPESSGSQARIVVGSGSYYPGFGKYFSRFLYMLPAQFRARACQDNESLSGDYLAEICGDAHFNANLHPALVSWEISYPTGEGGAQEGQLLVADLDVAADADDPTGLRLLHRPSGRRVLPLDLGFLNQRLRPPLYQLLSAFSPARSFVLPVPDALPSSPAVPIPLDGTASDATAAPGTGVQYRPRVSYAGQVVLARRRWVVAPAHVPRPHTHESDADYFVRVDNWRSEHRIPEVVYVRVMPAFRRTRASGDAVPPSAAPGKSHDPAKPQFVDFRSPMLVLLFGRLTAGLEEYRLVIEERLPAADELPVARGRRYVAELIMEVSVCSDTRLPDAMRAVCAPGPLVASRGDACGA